MFSNRFTSLFVVAVTSAAVLTGCGSGSTEGSPASSESAPSPEPSDGTGADRPGHPDPEFFTAMRACLEAAGLDDVLPDSLPGGADGRVPSGAPSGFPTDGSAPRPPDGAPPSGAPGRGGAFSALADPAVQDALEACGIELPTGPGS